MAVRPKEAEATQAGEQPELFQAPPGAGGTAPADPRREDLFARQIAAGIPADQARSYADRFVFAEKRKKPSVARKATQQPGTPSAKTVAPPPPPVAKAAAATPAPAADTPGTVAKRGLLPVLHPNRDFFLCDLFDYAMKDDGVSMEAPIFTLTTKPDTSVWHWESKDKSRSVTVTPSVLGRATQFDKDLLIYVVSQMTEALNRGRLDASQRTVRFRVYDYLVSTNKPVGGIEYRRLQEALERLRGTSIKTNIKTGGERVKEGFGILDTWKIIEKAPDDDRMIGVEVTLSKWLFNAVQANEVLTINADYFRLRKPIERRLYELARKHCGAQPSFTISLALLQDKCGSKAKLFEFRRMLREIVADDLLPDYQLVPDWPNDQITIRNRGPQPLLVAAKTTVEKA
jgi:hypothetical protein